MAFPTNLSFQGFSPFITYPFMKDLSNQFHRSGKALIICRWNLVVISITRYRQVPAWCIFPNPSPFKVSRLLPSRYSQPYQMSYSPRLSYSKNSFVCRLIIKVRNVKRQRTFHHHRFGVLHGVFGTVRMQLSFVSGVKPSRCPFLSSPHTR